MSESAIFNHYQHLLDYFSKYPQKKQFFINDLVIDLKLSEPILSKQLLQLTSKYPAIGSYNRNSGWFIRSNEYYPFKLKKNYLLFKKDFLIVVLIFFFSILINWSIVTFIATLFALGLVMNEVFDNMNYLKDFKL